MDERMNKEQTVKIKCSKPYIRLLALKQGEQNQPTRFTGSLSITTESLSYSYYDFEASKGTTASNNIQ